MRYTEQTRNPYQYYLNALKTAVYSMANGNDKIAAAFYKDELKAIDELNNDLPSVQAQPNHPERLMRTAEYISEFIFRNALTIKSFDKTDITPCYAVEYYTYDFEEQFNTDKPYYRNEYGDYDKKMNRFWSLVRSQPASKDLLTKPDQLGYYNAINFDEITKSLKYSIKTYYSTHPDLLGNVSPDEEFQTEFGKLLGKITTEIAQKKTNRNSYYRSF